MAENIMEQELMEIKYICSTMIRSTDNPSTGSSKCRLNVMFVNAPAGLKSIDNLSRVHAKHGEASDTIFNCNMISIKCGRGSNDNDERRLVQEPYGQTLLVIDASPR
jgi:hypothetical protein